MIHLFGHRFSSVYGESPTDGLNLTDVGKTWASALRDLEGYQIADGLRLCVARGDEWPPSLPNFVSMCKGGNGFNIGYVPEYHRKPTKNPERLLCSDKRSAKRKQMSKKYTTKMRGILNGKKD